MKIVFVSNYLNHHQIPFCDNMTILCDEFFFVATQNVTADSNYQLSATADYVVNYYDISQRQRAEELIKSADVAILGACSNEIVNLRIAEGKLTFLYSERFFKKGTWRRFIPTTRKKVYNRVVKYKGNGNFYVLCASAFLPYDLSLLGFNTDKCYKWGYFPQVKYYEDVDKLINNKAENSIFWGGRFLDWKHPDDVIKVAVRLKQNGYKFTLNFAGDGEMMPQLRQMVSRYNLSDCVNLLGSMSTEKVREYMEQSQIFLFTSDRREGWGAVLNESMNSACAVVASSAIGSAPYLIDDNQDGLIYKSGDVDDLYNKVVNLLDNKLKCQQYGKNAYNTLTEYWNAENVAEQFVNLATNLLNGQEYSAEYGPCSKASVIKDNWRV